MDRSVRQIAHFIITSLLGAIVLSSMVPPTNAQEVAAQPSTRSVTATTAGQVPHWVLTADQYVRVSNGVAQVSPVIYSRLDPATVRQVVQAVVQFNALDQQYRLGDVRVSTPLRSQDAVIEATCRGRSEIRISTHWWGQQYWLSSCTVLSVVAAGGSAAAIAGIIAAVCGACAPVAGVLAGVLALYTGWIAWADQYCGGSGVYVNRPWTGPVWVSRVC